MSEVQVSEVQKKMSNVEIITDAFKAIDTTLKYNEIKFEIKLDEEIDLTEAKSFTIEVKDKFKRYQRRVFNMKGNEAMAQLSEDIFNSLDGSLCSSYNTYIKCDKVGFIISPTGNAMKFTTVKVNVKFYHAHSPGTVTVEFTLV